jgi:hypothetical protein
MPCSGMLRRVALVIADVSEECSASSNANKGHAFRFSVVDGLDR